MSPSSDNLIRVDGFWVDLATVESTLTLALAAHSVIFVKLVPISDSRLALFFTSLSTVEELVLLKSARDSILTFESFPASLASRIFFAMQLLEMPVDENGNIQNSVLQFIAVERMNRRRSARNTRGLSIQSSEALSRVNSGMLSPPAATHSWSAFQGPAQPEGSNSASSSRDLVQIVPSIVVYSPEPTPSTEESAYEFPSPVYSAVSPAYNTTPRVTPPARPSSIINISRRSVIALEIASHITTLLSLPASSAVPTYLPFKLAGLTSITITELYYWLQERYEFMEDISRLFEDNVSAEIIAARITGETRDSIPTPISSTFSAASSETVSAADSEDDAQIMSVSSQFDEIDLEKGVSKTIVKDPESTYRIQPNVISYVLLSWITNLMLLGNRRPLVADDLYLMNPKDESKQVDAWTNQFWAEYETWSKAPSKDIPRLWGSMMIFARSYIISSALLWFLYIAFTAFTPLLIQQLIVALSAPPKPTTVQGIALWDQAIKEITGGVPLFTTHLYVLALSLFGVKILQTLCGRTADQLIRRAALNIKTALAGAVYRKSLRLGVQGLGRFEKGYILNLVNVDTEAISKAIELGNLMWSIPVQLGIIVYLLSRVLGVSVWAGVGVLFLSLVILVLVVPIFFRTSVPMFMRYGDMRMKAIKETMEGMTLIKVRGWESLFLRKLETIRLTQLGYLRIFSIGVTIFVTVGQSASTLVPMAALSLFGKEMGVISAARVFPAISFFSMLIEPLIAIPQLLSAVSVAGASWGRIYTFLIAAECVPVSKSNHPVVSDPIRIVNGSFQWSKPADTLKGPAPKKEETPEEADQAETFMRGINISIKKGSLTAIVGNVGSGKSSILSAILGEMECVSGQVFVNGSVAYCPQQAWIQSTTVEENITFGKPMEIRRFKKAIHAASFAADLERLPNGIASEIAEKGANLSGGQKARLSLARAVYADADLVLLDDPFAALDPRVSRTVFQECVLGALHKKTRVLVTQALHFLPQVDHIIVINNGVIVEQGTYAQLHRQKGQLRKMVDAMEKRSDKPAMKAAKQQDTAQVIKAQTKTEHVSSGAITTEEDITTGAIRGATWWGYLKAAGGWFMVIVLLTSLLAQQSGVVMLNQWLTWWTQNEFHHQTQFWFGIYDGISAGVAIFLVCVNICILFGALAASRTFHSRAFSGVLSAPMGWFHANPAGRVMNRFSKDVESIDQRLMPQIYQAIISMGGLISTITILARSAPVILGILGPLLVVYYFLLRFYRKSLRELKRLESRSRSPLQSKVNETLDGLPTIAAYRREMDFAASAHPLIDNSNKPVYLRNSAEIWVTLRMELLSSLVVLAVAMLGLSTTVMKSNEYGSALSYAAALSFVMNIFVKASAAIESEMSSVERLQEYAESLPKDAEHHLPTDPPEGTWPSRGEIVFRNVTAAYPSRPEKPALRNVDFYIRPGTTVFIVGRTGSGKSTLLSVLLRLLEIGSGSVFVDNEDITKLGTHTLRRGMELIPQDPFIFSGTIRTALDFEGCYDDTSLWHALELVGLKDFVSSQESKLDTKVSDNGSNYSVGQRQLLCLAGAILRNPKVLLLDEATASVDGGSDAFLQRTMRNNCPEATILSVMHRLSDQVLKECDKVLVMDDGVPAEFDTPKALLSRPDSLFSRIMEATHEG